ncbi:MAG: hypothetical protein ACLTYN_07290 [Dysosmobacter welbionis]
MGAVSSIGKEWNEQAAFAAYVTGKTLDEVAGIAVDEATKPAEADWPPASPSPSAASRPCWKTPVRLRLLSLLLPCLLLTACAARRRWRRGPSNIRRPF